MTLGEALADTFRFAMDESYSSVPVGIIRMITYPQAVFTLRRSLHNDYVADARPSHHTKYKSGMTTRVSTVDIRMPKIRDTARP